MRVIRPPPVAVNTDDVQLTTHDERCKLWQRKRQSTRFGQQNSHVYMCVCRAKEYVQPLICQLNCGGYNYHLK